MPVYNYSTLNPQGGIIVDKQTLINKGPLIRVEISIPLALATYNQQNGIAIPSPKIGFALIDTGCSITSIDDATISSLGVNPVGVRPVGTASGGHDANLYPAHVKFPDTKIEIDYNSVLSAKLVGQGIIALIGRDILSECVLVYNGTTGMYTFAH